MTNRRPAVVIHPRLKDDLQQLADAASVSPNGPEQKLLRAALTQIEHVQGGGTSTHPLEYMPTYPDLSDCQTSYVGIDPNRKPSHRLIWRERPAQGPGQRPTREILAFGERERGAAYHLAGQRLGRPVGVTLAELQAAPEPISPRTRQYQTHTPTSKPEPELEP